MSETKRMPRVRRWLITGLMAVSGVLAAPFASADSVLLEVAPLISGTQQTIYSVTTSGPGSLSVSLANLGWPERLSSLSFAFATSSGILKTFTGDTQSTLDIGSAGTYYAIVTGTAQGHWNLGMYSMRLGFSALDGPAPVPLPGGVSLLLLGFAALRMTRWFS